MELQPCMQLQIQSQSSSSHGYILVRQNPSPFLSTPANLPFPSSPSSLHHRRLARAPAVVRPSSSRSSFRREKHEDAESDEDDDLGPFSKVQETEEEAKRRHWVTRYWAPWEEELSPEAQFALDCHNLGQGEEPIIPLEMMERLYVNKPLIPKPIPVKDPTPDPDYVAAAQQGARPGTAWKKPMVFSLVPPRDWPPPGWKVDPDKLAFIREAHAIADRRVKLPDVSKAVEFEQGAGGFKRWKMFLIQYHEWVAANKERLDREEEELGDEYHPGRRRMGEEYVEGMYELPFIYPGQHYAGVVTMIHLYEGAFVNIGAVHDGWVPIKRNDWYWVREKIRVGMQVQVEVIAKRDPYRFRFPIELRFVHPNINHLVFNRFQHPPIFVRNTDSTNMDLITKETGRPYCPRRRPDPEAVEEEILGHPYVFKVWQLHVAEQIVLDDEENRAAGKVTPKEKFNEIAKRHYIDKDTYVTEEKIGDATIPSVFYIQHECELDLEGARKERQIIKEAAQEAEKKGEKFQPPKFRRFAYVEELNAMHRQRYLDEKAAVVRDKVCCLELGMPLEEPGRYADDSFFGENKYNPREKRWRADYLGDISKIKDDTRKDRDARARIVEVVSPDDEDAVGTSRGKRGIRGGYGTTKDEDVNVAKGNGDKVVNGTESSSILDIKGMFQSKELTGEDETDSLD